MNWILVLLGISWVATFTSQSLVDISDALVTGTALFMAFKRHEWKKLFTGFEPSWLWPIWLLVIAIGLILNADLASPIVWQDFLEFRWILTFLSWIYLSASLSERKNLFSKLAILTFLLNLGAMAAWIKNPNERAGGLLNAIMAFSQNIGPIFCLFSIFTLANWKNFKPNEKILFFLVATSSCYLTLVTFTRGVWIGCLVAFFATTLLWNKKIFAGVSSFIVVMFLIGISTSERFSNRVFNKTPNESQSNYERKGLWRANWEMVKEHPIFGVGLGTNKMHLRKYYDFFGYPEEQRLSHAHNQYLQYWAGTGTLGLICYLVFLFLILKYCYSGFRNIEDVQLRYLQLALLASLICFMVGSLTESNFNIAKNRFLLLMLAGMAVAWSKHQDKVAIKNSD